MIRLVVTILATAALLASTAVSQEGEAATVELARKIPSVGDVSGQMSKSLTKSSTSMSVDGEAMPTRDMSRTRTIRKKSEILGVAEKGVTKAKVTFMEITTDVEMPEMPEGAGGRGGRGRRRTREGEEVADDDEIVGQTYVIDMSGDVPTVTGEDGAEVSDAVARAVLRHEYDEGHYSGWGPPLHEIIPAGKMKVGQRIELDAKKFGLLMNARGISGGQPGEYSMTLSGTTTVLGVDCAVFDVRIKTSTTGDEPAGEGEGGRRRRGGPSESQMQGQAVVGLQNLWLYKLTLDGTTTSSMKRSRGERTMERSTDSTMKLETSSLFMAKEKTAQ